MLQLSAMLSWNSEKETTSVQGKLFTWRMQNFQANRYYCVWKELIMDQTDPTDRNNTRLQLQKNYVQTERAQGTLNGHSASELTHRESIMVD